MILPTSIAQDIADEATSAGADAQGGEHYHSRYIPQPLVSDLRFAFRSDLLTVWHSPAYRALVLARPGDGEMVFYGSQSAYETALQNARRGKLPEREEMELTR